MKLFLIVNQISSIFQKFFLKKVLAGKEKGCTFAPAFPRGEATERGDGEAEFFESLRPAQRPPRSPGGCQRRRERDREVKRSPEHRERK